MGSGRWVILVFLAAAGTVCSLHRGARGRIGGGLSDVRIRIFGAGADDHYRLAERYYVAGDYEKAVVSCERALKAGPFHRHASELRNELRFLLGSGSSTQGLECFSWQRAPSPSAQTLIEIDRCLDSAERFRQLGEEENACRQFWKVLEFVKWMPVCVEAERMSDRARRGLANLAPPTPDLEK